MKKIILFTILAIAVLFISACSSQEAASSPVEQARNTISTNLIKMQPTQSEKETSETQTALPFISASELSKHNYKTDCWVGYKSLVYDVTKWFARETDKIEFKDRVGSLALTKSEYDAMQSILLRHCGSNTAFEEEFDRTVTTIKKSRAFVAPIGILE